MSRSGTGFRSSDRTYRRRAGPVAELPSTILLNETAVIQHGEQFVLFVALDPATREVVHLSVASSRNYFTARRFLEEIEKLYGELLEVGDH